MFLEQFVLEGLGNSSYFVASSQSGEAVVVDPQRDVDIYLETAKQQGVRIAYILETHLHADFVSGSRELASATGASIAASAEAHLQFQHRALEEGEKIEIGELIFEVLETPGHSPEHISFLLRERDKEQPLALFSGGALIVGGIARTDLLGHEHAIPLAKKAYHTIQEKIKRLPDEVMVYPTHGAGSFCIASSERERQTTIGQERERNRLLHAESEEEFVRLALEGLPSYPVYFKRMRAVNQAGPRIFRTLPELAPLTPQRVKEHMEKGACVIDVRPFRTFARGHIDGAYHIVLNQSFSSWLGWIVPPSPLVFVASTEAMQDEIVRGSIRIGYDDLLGFLAGGMRAWKEAGYPAIRSGLTTVQKVREKLESGKPFRVLDVRQEDEWLAGHIPGAVHIELGELEKRAQELPEEVPIAVTCAHGNRASTGVSLLQRLGLKKVENIIGGTSAWRKARLPLQK